MLTRRPLLDEQIEETLRVYGLAPDAEILGISYSLERTTVTVAAAAPGEAPKRLVVPEEVLDLQALPEERTPERIFPRDL